MGEELLIGRVHLSKIVHGGDEDVDLDDLGERGAGGSQHGRQVDDALLGHLAEGVLWTCEDRAVGRAGDLARAEDHRGGLDGLAVGTGC